jgi:hypothetical protein
MANMTPDLQGYAGQCSLGSPGFPPSRQRSYIGSGLLPARPSPLYSFPMWPTLPPFLFLYNGGFDWWHSLQPPAHACTSLADFSTLKMEAIRSSETSVHTRSTQRHTPEDIILHSHRRENLKSYICVICQKL